MASRLREKVHCGHARTRVLCTTVSWPQSDPQNRCYPLWVGF